MHYVVTLHGRVTVKDGSGAQPANADELIEEHFDAVMEELIALKAVDPAIALEAATGNVKLNVLVESDDPDGAVPTASVLLRTAIHAAGGSTPDWPGNDNRAWQVILVSFLATPVDLVHA